ncbi:MAG: PDZ domain-containing protein [Gemmataceae bacterium]|nr:PDZ domain-containing protein [Gemmataceae bacterium]MDW8267453.1 PDZ domain-containing protein [Gemmataceae bacterium]
MRPLVLTLVSLWSLATPTWAQAPPQADTYQVPYRLTETKHVLVRVKINGHGPFHFLIDTGAPALFVATAVGKKVGVAPDTRGWATFKRFEIEGGVVIENARGRLDDPFQLEGMNKLGLAGVELHGVIGYNLLARYKLEFDFTRPTMTWTRLQYEPPEPTGLGRASAGLEGIALLVRMLSGLLARDTKVEIKPRGLLGMELEETAEGVWVRAVLANGPADRAGLKSGDRLVAVRGRAVARVGDVHRRLASVGPDEDVSLTLVRQGKAMTLTVTTGRGL